MPSESIVPWVQGADPARYFGPMFGEAANASSRRAQLGQEMMRMQMQQAQHAAELQAHQEQQAQEMELKKQVMQQNQLMDQQRNAITQQYHQQQNAIKEQQAQEASKKNALAAQNMAAKSSAMMQYQQRVQSGEDPNKVMMELGPRMSGGSMGGMGSILKQGAPPPQAQFGQSPSGRGYAQIGNQLKWEPNAATPKPTQDQLDEKMLKQANLQESVANIKRIQNELTDATDKKVIAKKTKELADARKEQRAILHPDEAKKNDDSGVEKTAIINGRLMYVGKNTDNLPDLIQGMQPAEPQQMGLQPGGIPIPTNMIPPQQPPDGSPQPQMPAAAGLPFGM